MKNRVKSVGTVLKTLFCVLIFLIFRLRVYAAISSCSASVNVSSVTTNTVANYTFTITNTDTVPVRWIRITRPSQDFTMGGFSIQGWNTTSSADVFTLTGGALAVNGMFELLIQVQSGLSEAPPAAWTVEVSDSVTGSQPYACTGLLSTQIAGNPPDTTSPELSEVGVTDVTSTSVRILWTTNEAASTVVQYGTTDVYGTTASSDLVSLVTNHSILLTGLLANTTYHFTILSTDSAGNEGWYGDDTFATAVAQPTPLPERIVETKTTTQYVLVTPTPGSFTPTPTRPPFVQTVPIEEVLVTTATPTSKPTPEVLGAKNDPTPTPTPVPVKGMTSRSIMVLLGLGSVLLVWVLYLKRKSDTPQP